MHKLGLPELVVKFFGFNYIFLDVGCKKFTKKKNKHLVRLSGILCGQVLNYFFLKVICFGF